MDTQSSQTENHDLQAELDRLTYSAYLLTVDPGVAVSVVMQAIDWSLEEITSDPGLLQRTVELALEQSHQESSRSWDGESSALDAVLYGHSAPLNASAFQSVKELTGSPILLLDSTSRIAFVLHHVLGYSVREAAKMAQMNETEYRSQLQTAYVQLAGAPDGNLVEEPALA